jgi:hypothetical protein
MHLRNSFYSRRKARVVGGGAYRSSPAAQAANLPMALKAAATCLRSHREKRSP